MKIAINLNDRGYLYDYVDMGVSLIMAGSDYSVLTPVKFSIEELKEIIDAEGLDVDIEVDGGINDETMETVLKAGANLLVAGSYVFNGDLETNVYSIQKKMDKIKSEID